MHKPKTIDISSFFAVGINYKKSDASIRGKFSVPDTEYEKILAAAAALCITEVFVLSTCNRTEIYGFAESATDLVNLLCQHTQGDFEQFMEMAYIKSGAKAIEHLFNVAAGLDSQILGDYEIIGQIKKSAKFSKERGFIGAYLERLINEVLQASKKIRTNTVMSAGTVSVSFTAVQYIRQKFTKIGGLKILLLGTGKIGNNICKNLVDYLPGAAVKLINRDTHKAAALAEIYGFDYGCMNNLAAAIKDADVVLVATNAAEPLILAKHFCAGNDKLVLDLSVPCNVEPAVKNIDSVELVNIDELSKIKDATLLKRSAEIPKVKMIIADQMAEFMAWHEMRRYVPVLKDIKNKLLTIRSDSLSDTSVMFAAVDCKNIGSDKIQKVIDGMAVKMRTRNQPGCHYIEAINDFISTASRSNELQY